MLKPMQKLYRINNVLSYEQKIDQVLDILKTILDKLADGRAVDIGNQLIYAACDVIRSMTLGVPDGYLEKQCDFEGTLADHDAV